jgi:antitoxin VapB
MPITRAFRSGNSQAIRIPADLAYADTSLDLTITRHGDVITIMPARPGLRQMAETLRSLPKPPSVEPREPIELPDRDLD